MKGRMLFWLVGEAPVAKELIVEFIIDQFERLGGLWSTEEIVALLSSEFPDLAGEDLNQALEEAARRIETR